MGEKPSLANNQGEFLLHDYLQVAMFLQCTNNEFPAAFLRSSGAFVQIKINAWLVFYRTVTFHMAKSFENFPSFYQSPRLRWSFY